MRRGCHSARRIGHTADQLIRPARMKLTHKLLSPTTEDTENANRISEAFESAVAQCAASVSGEGKMLAGRYLIGLDG